MEVGYGGRRMQILDRTNSVFHRVRAMHLNIWFNYKLEIEDLKLILLVLHPYEIFATRGICHLPLSTWGTEGERKDNIFCEYCKTQAIISKIRHFACPFLHLLLPLFCYIYSQFFIHILSFSFNLLHPEGPSLNSNLANCTHTGLSALILTAGAKPAPGEACHRWQHRSLWLGDPKCIAQSCCSSLTASPSQNVSSSFLFSLHMRVVRHW